MLKLNSKINMLLILILLVIAIPISAYELKTKTIINGNNITGSSYNNNLGLFTTIINNNNIEGIGSDASHALRTTTQFKNNNIQGLSIANIPQSVKKPSPSIIEEIPRRIFIGGGSSCAKDGTCPRAPTEEELASMMPKVEHPSRVQAKPSMNHPAAEVCLFATPGIYGDKIFKSNIQEDFKQDIIEDPFTINCEKNKLDITLNIPDNYENLKVLKCNGNCEEIPYELSNEMNCEGNKIKNIRKQDILKEDYFVPEINEEKIFKSENNILEINGITLEFLEENNASGEFINNIIQQPNNPSLSIIGTPIKINYEKNTKARISVKFQKIEGIEKTDIFIYDKIKNTGWTYIPSMEENGSLTAIIDLSEFSNEIILSKIGILCEACDSSVFKQVHSVPYATNSIIFVHGFASDSKAFIYIMDDIILNEIPWNIYTFEYPSTFTVDEIGKEFADKIETNSVNMKNIYIVSHSLGGLVTQHALSLADQARKQDNSLFTFLPKVKKAIIMGTPHDGIPSPRVFEQLFNYLINSKTLTKAFNFDSNLINQLLVGRTYPKVDGVKYEVIAGTKSLEFNLKGINIRLEEILGYSEPNDGLATISSASHIGNSYQNNFCEDYFEIGADHIAMTDINEGISTVEYLLSREDAKENPEQALLGFNQYLRFNIKKCDPNDKFIILGNKISEDETPGILGCKCGNGICGVDETEITCPSDCAVRSFFNCYNLTIFSYISLILTLIVSLIYFGNVYIARKTHHINKLIKILEYIFMILTTLIITYHKIKCSGNIIFVYGALVILVLYNIIESHLMEIRDKKIQPPIKKENKLKKETTQVYKPVKQKQPTYIKKKYNDIYREKPGKIDNIIVPDIPPIKIEPEIEHEFKPKKYKPKQEIKQDPKDPIEEKIDNYQKNARELEKESKKIK